MSQYERTDVSRITILTLILVGSIYLVSEYDNRQASGVPLTSTVTNSVNFSTYQNSSFGIKMQYPSDWKQIEDFQGSWFRNANESVNVRVESVAYPNGSLGELTTRQVNLTEHQFPGQVIVESNETTIGDNYTAHKIVFTYPEAPSDPRRIIFKELQVLTINDIRAYIISYFTLADAYENYLPTVQKMIDSFRITSVAKK
jgi:hypothetical protein